MHFLDIYGILCTSIIIFLKILHTKITQIIFSIKCTNSYSHIYYTNNNVNTFKNNPLKSGNNIYIGCSSTLWSVMDVITVCASVARPCHIN